jgi:D-alanyl-D-alanine carboxypeptidase (penicillin-binding protein 5/6)
VRLPHLARASLATALILAAAPVIIHPHPANATALPVGGGALGSRGIVVPRGAPPLPKDITGQAWLVADLSTGAVLGARNPHGKYLPASTLKTLTALTLLPKLTNRRQIVQATPADVNIDGTRVGLIPKGKYSVGMLFQCMLMMSGNDCAGALAEANGGIPLTVSQMNAEAARLQASDTHAATPSGLDGPKQATSAYDLALILRQDLTVPDFRKYNTTKIGYVPPQPPKYGTFQFANDNKLLYNYPGVLAAKNGYTDAARHTFVAAVAKGNRRIVVTLLHGEQTPQPIWKQVAALADWAVRVPAGASVGRLVDPIDPTKPTPTATSNAISTTAPSSGRAAAEPSDPGGPGWPVWVAAGGLAGLIGVGAIGYLARRRAWQRATARPPNRRL